jgi:hypothetical protein
MCKYSFLVIKRAFWFKMGFQTGTKKIEMLTLAHGGPASEDYKMMDQHNNSLEKLLFFFF